LWATSMSSGQTGSAYMTWATQPSPKKVLAFGVSFDWQKELAPDWGPLPAAAGTALPVRPVDEVTDYYAAAADVFWDLPMGNNALTGTAAFLWYNKTPAKVFPGDTLTYCVGAMIAIVAILANIEKFALLLFIPYYIEFVLKARGSLLKESYGKIAEDGSIKNAYRKFYGIEHVAIDILGRVKKKANEWEIVSVVWLFQLMVAGLVLASFFGLM